MKIAPISFGKAVRVNGSKELAYDIARLANEKKVPKAERTAQQQAQAIFDDVTGNAPAKVVSYKTFSTMLGRYYENVFIVSGKEAEEADRLLDEAVEACLNSDSKKLSKDEEESRHIFNIHGKDYTDEDIRENRQSEALNKYYSKLGTMLGSRQPNYEISATHNTKGTAIKSIEKEYASVYAIAGSEKQIEELCSILAQSKGNVTVHKATSLYEGRQGVGLCTEAAQRGKEIYFIVTGKETNDKIRFMEYGWSSLNGISRHIESFVELNDIKEQAKPIQEAIKHQ